MILCSLPNFIILHSFAIVVLFSSDFLTIQLSPFSWFLTLNFGIKYASIVSKMNQGLRCPKEKKPVSSVIIKNVIIMDSTAWVFAYISRTFSNLVLCFETASFASYQRNANVIVLFTISLELFNLKRVIFSHQQANTIYQYYH